MSGIDVGGGGGGGKKKLDSEINMVPFIDLLMVTISFLLITAVWTHMARLEVEARVPGPTRSADTEKEEQEKQLHVDMQTPGKFILRWKQAEAVLRTVEIPREDKPTIQGGVERFKYEQLATKAQEEWTAWGQHREMNDLKRDKAFLHTDNTTPYACVVGALDALYRPKRMLRKGEGQEEASVFQLTFSID